MGDYKYEIKPGYSGGYQYSVRTPEGQMLDYPINFIPFSINPGPVAKTTYFSGTTQTLDGAERACKVLANAHRRYGFIQTDTDGIIKKGTL